MDISLVHDKLLAYLRQHETEMYTLLEHITNQDTFSHDGPQVDALGVELSTWLRDAGFTVETLPSPPVPDDEPWFAHLGHVIVARSHPVEAGAGVVLPGHLDTVFPMGTCAARPFRKENGLVKGPGVADMKAGVVMNLFVARALKSLGLTDMPITLTLSPDEELGSPSVTRLLPPHVQQAVAVLCTEPAFKGKIITSRNGSGHMHIRVKGKSAHSGRHFFEGISAIQELAHKVIAINELVDGDRGMTVNVGLINGGNSTNAVAPHAEAFVHLAYPSVETGRELEEGVRAVVQRQFVPGSSATVSGGLRLFPMLRTPEGDRLFALARKAGAMAGLTLEHGNSKGAAETGFFSSILGIPSLCCMGPDSGEVHTPDEYFEADSYLPRALTLGLTIAMLGQTADRA